MLSPHIFFVTFLLVFFNYSPALAADSFTLRQNAKIQWELASDHCDIGLVDGIRGSKNSLTNQCLKNLGIKLSSDSDRTLNELRELPRKLGQMNLEQMQKAMKGLYPTLTSGNKINEHKIKSAQAARASLKSLLPSRLLPYLLIGIDMKDERVSSFCKELLRKENYSKITSEVWHYSILSEGVTTAVKYYLEHLNQEDIGQHSSDLLSIAYDHNSHLMGDELLGEILQILWRNSGEKKQVSINSYPITLIEVLLNTPSNSNQRLDTHELYALFRKLGKSIFGSLINYYIRAGSPSASASIIEEFFIQLDNKRHAFQAITFMMNGSDTDIQLQRLLNLMTPDTKDSALGFPKTWR